jgi:hypothetical protein
MAAFLANVGVNAAHRVKSPLFPDGSFLLRPIPEKQAWAPPSWNSFWVFRGGQGTRLLPRAVPFRRLEAEATLGPGLCWRAHRSEQQTIGSYTRAVRRLIGAREAQLRRLCRCPS